MIAAASGQWLSLTLRRFETQITNDIMNGARIFHGGSDGERVIISTPMKNHMLIDHEYVNCPLRFDDRIRPANLLPIHMLDFDVILGMDWLASHRATIDCYARTVIFGNVRQPEFVYHGSSPLKSVKLISAMKARTLISHGCQGFLASVMDTSLESPNIENLSVVREFADVFPKKYFYLGVVLVGRFYVNGDEISMDFMEVRTVKSFWDPVGKLSHRLLVVFEILERDTIIHPSCMSHLTLLDQIQPDMSLFREEPWNPFGSSNERVMRNPVIPFVIRGDSLDNHQASSRARYLKLVSLSRAVVAFSWWGALLSEVNDAECGLTLEILIRDKMKKILRHRSLPQDGRLDQAASRCFGELVYRKTFWCRNDKCLKDLQEAFSM
ncbi:putative reverse transcriptase domain-containing protein [Tanacetum coccineum]